MKECNNTLGDALPAVSSLAHGRPGHRFCNMLTITALVIWKLLLPLLILIAIIDWLTASDDRRVRVLATTGRSQRQIADRLHLTRYRVRKALAS